MLVVIAIIALIAAVLTPQLLGQLSRARAKTAQLQLDTVASAVELFRTDVGRYPSQGEGLNALLQDPGNAEGWTGPYLKDGKITRDPWNRPINYQLDATADRFTVTSLGSDGKEGGVSGARDLRSPAPVTLATTP
jgi:general secretion pathway protein G